MGSPLIKRLDALYQRAQMVMAVQADHAPFGVFRSSIERRSKI